MTENWHPITYTDPRVTHTSDADHIRNCTLPIQWTTRRQLEALYTPAIAWPGTTG